MLRPIASVLAMMLLASCEVPTAATPPAAAANVPVAPPVAANPAPGARTAPDAFASATLDAACLATRPDFAATPRELARIGGFVQSEKTGTYFHRTYDLSVKVVPGRCSLVTGIAGRAPDASGIRRATRDPASVRIGNLVPAGDTIYVSFFVRGSG